MGLFRKLKKLGSFLTLPDDDVRPRSRRRHHMRDEAVLPNNEYGPLPGSFFNAVDSARQQAGYDPLPIFAREPIPGEENDFMDQDFAAEFGAFDRPRSKSHDKSFDLHRSKSNDRSFDRSSRHFRHPPPGTPIKYRRRPASPDFLRPSASSPFLFRQHSLPSSPDMLRRFQQDQQRQHFLRQQQDMMMNYPQQFYPQFQQQPFYPMMNPNVNMNGWFMMPQPQMHQFF